eukprot:19399_1
MMISALLDDIIADLAALEYPKPSTQNRHTNRKTYSDKKIRTSVSHPLQIDWLHLTYEYASKLPAKLCSKKLKFIDYKNNHQNRTVSIDFKIGMTLCPGKHQNKSSFVWKRDLHIDLDYIKQQNVDIVVTILSHKDVTRLTNLGVESLVNEIEKRGMESIWYDMGDGSIPKNKQLWKQYASYVGDQLTKQNKIVLVHCMGGMGRTGAFILTVLKYLKLIDNDSIGQGVFWINKSRKGAGGTASQIQFVHSLQF